MNGKSGNSFETLRRFGERYRADAAVRARVGSGDYSALELELPAGTEVRVLEQTPDTYYFPLPPEPNPPLSDEMLESVAGGTGRAEWVTGPHGYPIPTGRMVYCHGTAT